MRPGEDKIEVLVLQVLLPVFPRRLAMLKKRYLIVSASILLTFCLAPSSNAAYFVFNKKGNIRSGPGTKYRVIGQLAKETIAQIPDTFTDYEAKWIAIDAKTESDNKRKGGKVVYTKWVHRNLGVVIKGDIHEVDKYFAIKESGWPKDIQELVLAGKVEVGMTTHMVFYAWGKPDQINETSEPHGAAEQWVYNKQGSKRQYLYFKDGVLTSMRN